MLINNNTPNSPCEHRRKAFKVDISHFDDKLNRSKYPPISEKTLISPMSTTLQSTSLRQSSTFQMKLDSCFFKFKSFLLYILHHSITNITVFTLSLIVIFLHDINALISTGTYDTLVDAVYCIVLIVFVCEFTAKSVALSGYVLSAVFFLDMLSLIGMALEIRNHCVMIADLLVKEKIDERYLNSNQINVYVSLTKLAQIMKSTLVIKVYNFIQNVRKKMEVNARMKELQRMINEKEHKKYCNGNSNDNNNNNKKGKLSPNRNNNTSNCATINNSNSNTKKNKMSCLQSPRDSYPYNVGGIDINKCNNNNLNNSNVNNSNMNNSNINNSSLDNNYISCTPISFSSFSNFVNTNNTNKPSNNEVKPIIPSNTNINVPSPLITNPNILSIGAVPTTNYVMNTSQSNFLNTNNNNNESIPPISISNLLQNNNTNINNNIPPIHNTNSNNANFLHLHSRMSKIYDYSSYLSSRTGYFSTTQNQINNTNNTTTTPFITTTNFNSILHSNMRRKNSECEDMHENALIQLNKINLYKQRKRFELENESQISKIVTKNISDKSLLLILLILFLFPLFNEDNFITSSDTTSYEYICEQVDQQYILHNGTLPTQFLTQINTFIRDHINDWGQHIIMLNHSHYSKINGVIYINDTFRSSSAKMLRSNEIAISSIRRNSSNNVDHSTHAHTYIEYSIRYLVHIMCIIDIVRNVCLFVILYTFSYRIFEDTKTNILTPLEITTNTVNIVAKDPVNFQSLEKLNQSIMNYTRKKKTLYSTYNNNYLNSQIKTIQFSIIRICKLMAIGFGEAGGQILRDNMNSFEGLNPMLPGKKISGIFGFCLIRNFSQINEALQEKTILFVNEIASIVHTNVQKFGGVCNKNIGESFLLIWKFNTPSSSSASSTKDPVTLLDEVMYSNRSTSKQHKEHLNEQNTPNTNTNTYTHKQHIINSQQETNNNNSLSNINSNEKNLLADSAVMAFLAVIKKITKSRISDKYENDAQLQKITLTPSCINNNSSNKYKKFKIKMGFGLHVGWGVEGAIGSYHKIDCSYLSPNVNIAARLETATNIYGVEMLFSGEIYNLMSNSLQRKCRLIDCVTLKGSVTPVKLYTIDVNKSIPKGKSKHKKMSDKEKRAQNEYKKTQMFDDMKKYDKSIDVVYMDKSKGMRNLLKNPKSEVFLMCFKKGYDNYIKGNWNKAYSLLKQALFIDWNDGPTNALIKYIEKFNCKAPEDWKGYRALSSKF